MVRPRNRYGQLSVIDEAVLILGTLAEEVVFVSLFGQIRVANIGEDAPLGVLQRPRHEPGVHAVDAGLPEVGSRGPHHLRRRVLDLGVVPAPVAEIWLQHSIHGYIVLVAGFDDPVYRHLGIENETGISHRHDEVEQALAQPGADVESSALVQRQGRVDARSDQSRVAGSAPDRRRRIAYEVRQHGRLFGGFVEV